MNADLVERIINNWQSVIPGINTDGTQIVARIVRLANFINMKVDKNLAEYELTVGEFDVLAALRRNPALKLTPGKLQSLVMITSGGLTNRLNRLEQKGYISRHNHPHDRRGSIVMLTDKGKILVEKVAPTHLGIEYELIKSLSPKDRQALSTLLKKLLLSLENDTK